MARKPLYPFTRFLPDPQSGCWEWQGGKCKGYGVIGGRGAHRVFYERYNGPIPPGLLVRHTCDNPGCVNPDHLELGTKQDNADDMKDRGRSPKCAGELNPATSLTVEQVRAIFVDTRTQGAIAADYGIHRTAVNLIQSRKTWAKETADLKQVKRKMGPPSRKAASDARRSRKQAQP